MMAAASCGLLGGLLPSLGILRVHDPCLPRGCDPEQPRLTPIALAGSRPSMKFQALVWVMMLTVRIW